MGLSSSKYKTCTSITGSTTDEIFNRDMDGPSFYCAYLGFSPISKPPTNLNALLNPIRDMYFKYRKIPTGSRSASLKLTQKGVFVSIYEDGVVKSEIFFEFSSVIFVEAVRFFHVKTSSEKKPKALFVPADDSKPVLSDKHAFSVEKSFHFLISSTHPPLLVCVVRRPAGVKALDCHVFALDTVENALHISALISSTQPLPTSTVGRLDVVDNKGKSGFDRGVRGDVIRTEYGDYSVYRGSFEAPPPGQGQRYGTNVAPLGGPVVSPVRNAPPGPMSGGLILTQENFRDSSLMSQQQFMNEPAPGGQPMYDYRNRPDVIMHVRQRSGDSSDNTSYERSFIGGAGPDQGMGRMRMDEVQMRGGQRLSSSQVPVNNRLSSGVYSSGPQFSSSGPQFSPRNSDATLSPLVTSPRSSVVIPPTSPRVQDFGPIFSASNLESRVIEEDPKDPSSVSKPVAKVPPHMKGIKVLPTDFRAVKLKANADKPADYLEDSENNQDLKLRENNRDPSYQPGLGKMGSSYGDNGGFNEFPQRGRQLEDSSRDFSSNWQETIRAGPGTKVDEPVYRRSSPSGYNQQESNNNRYSMPAVYGDQMGRQWGAGPKSHSSYHMDGQYSSTTDSLDPLARMKDLEIANMFTDYRQQQQNRPTGDMYRGRNEFEEGLGYLP